MSANITGVVVPLITPFNNENQIDYSSLSRVIEFLVTKGVNALMVGGTTGEGMLLRLEERKQLLDTVIRQVAGKALVIAHTGCIETGYREYRGFVQTCPKSRRRLYFSHCSLFLHT